ncbi:MAG: hypothetical protein KatS3mg077_2860 [Candidatus Binatia bacterium]|nr:MAG: hypothetical protein KatS3mg077_2860 [Candidatus Binatia bacterium]
MQKRAVGLARTARKMVSAWVAAVFVLATVAPPVGLVAHRHAGDDYTHVHPWFGFGWLPEEIAPASMGEALPFADNDTPVDWWLRPRKLKGQQPAVSRQAQGRASHVHAFSPFHPSLLASVACGVTVAPLCTLTATLPEDPSFRRSSRRHSRAPPAPA